MLTTNHLALTFFVFFGQSKLTLQFLHVVSTPDSNRLDSSSVPSAKWPLMFYISLHKESTSCLAEGGLFERVARFKNSSKFPRTGGSSVSVAPVSSSRVQPGVTVSETISDTGTMDAISHTLCILPVRSKHAPPRLCSPRRQRRVLFVHMGTTPSPLRHGVSSSYLQR